LVQVSFLSVLLKELRPHQWVKNLLVFLPLVTSHQLNVQTLTNALLGLVCFSLAASSIYILNDILDIKDDQADPIKKHRPIASGALSVSSAIKLMIVLITAVIGLCFFIPIDAVYILVAYYVLTTAYSMKLKSVPIMDIFILSSLYSVRVLFGQSMTNITLSAWLIVFCMFFFLSLACMKRVSELYQVKNKQQQLSKRRGYCVDDLDMLMPTGIGCALISVLVIGLYINSDQVKLLYQYPNRMWFIAFVLLFWKMRLWFLGVRGLIDRDPVIFVMKDKPTYVVALLILLTAFLAS
jgi:4-hydroxybenzoate polyprenyltransferase